MTRYRSAAGLGAGSVTQILHVVEPMAGRPGPFIARPRTTHADRLNQELSLRAVEARDGEVVMHGTVYVAPAGARTLVQDEATCVVYGMPREAWKQGAAEAQVPEMAGEILARLGERRESTRRGRVA